MRKAELQEVYREIKRNKTNKKPSLLEPNRPKNTGGCRTCGKVTWRPNQ